MAVTGLDLEQENAAISTVPAASPGGGELALAGVILALLLAGQVLVTGTYRHLNSYLWEDEILTYQAVSDPGLGHAIHAIAHVGDVTPPVTYTAMRLFCLPFGRVDPALLRAFSLLCAGVGLLASYALIRRRFAVLPSAVAVLTVWADPVLVQQAFEARFYAAWFGATALFCLALACTHDTRRPARGAVALALTSILALSTHYFGILVVGWLCAVDFLCDERPFSRRLKRLAPVALGLAAWVLWVRFFYLGQRAELTRPFWTDPVDPGRTRQYLTILLSQSPITALLIVAWLAALVGVLRRSWPRPLGDLPRILRDYVPVATLFCLPAIYLAISWASVSVLLNRYTICMALALLPLAAVLTASLSSRAALVPLLVMLALATTQVYQAGRYKLQGTHNEIEANIRQVRALAPEGQVVFERLSQGAPVWLHGPDLRSRVALLDFELSPGQTYSNVRIVERDIARSIAREYGEATPLLSFEKLQRLPRFYYFAGSAKTVAEIPNAFPGFTARHVGGTLFEMTRQP